MSSVRKYIIGVAFVSLATPTLAVRGQDSPDPIYWKQSVFSIPYQINRPDTADDAPLEVRLLVSRDAGATWNMLQSAKPHVKGFIYNAEQEDGHYWFAVQTVDRFGRQHPATDIQPELHVVVDTMPPKLQVNAEVNAGGDVVIHCEQEDANIDVEKLSVSVRPEGGKLQPLQIPEGDMDGASRLVQELTFVPPLGTRSVQIRAETSDLAGNHGIAQFELDLVTARRTPMGTVAAGRSSARPTADPLGTAANPTDVWMPASDSAYPQAGSGTGRQGPLVDPPQLAGGSGDVSQGRVGQPWPADRTALAPPQSGSLDRRDDRSNATGPPSGQVGGFEQLPPPIAGPGPSWSARQTSAPLAGAVPAAAGPSSGRSHPTGVAPNDPTLPNAEAESGPLLVGSGSAAPPEEIGVGEVLPVERPHTVGGYPDTGAPALNVLPSAGGGVSPLDHRTAAAEDSHASEPSDAGWQMVNSRTIAIDYEVASLGPWGVSAVELWGTRDGGQSWRRYAVDDDNRSPVTATVEGEGDYGFRVLVHSAGGFPAAPPKRGDPPEALVRVDLVHPEATLTSVEQGTGNLADQIMIRWSASDAQLAQHPVTLYYSAQPAGPWSIIAANLVNSGSYAWRADRHLPEQLYVRLEVRDAAGNTTTYQTADPIVINRPRPQVRIREIRSFNGATVQAGSGP